MRMYSFGDETEIRVYNKRGIKYHCNKFDCAAIDLVFSDEYPHAFRSKKFDPVLFDPFDLVFFELYCGDYEYYFRDLDSMSKFSVILELS